jgi:hypothetical protein
MVAVVVASGWASITMAFDVREQLGLVAAIADGNTVTDTLPTHSPGSVSVTAGSPEPGSDYALASLQTEYQSDQLHVVASADVGEWGNEGAAKIRLEVQFSVERDTPYTINVARAESTGLGWLGERASIVLSNADGVILRRHPGGGFDACDYTHPNADTLCRNRTLTLGLYTLEVLVSAYAPGTCGSCKGYANSADVELTIQF